ncbi:Triosephosphate isomerase, partial [Haemophilus influenzae]
YG